MFLDSQESTGNMKKCSLLLFSALIFVGGILVGCGGGGGGGGSITPVQITGRVLRAETGAAPSPAATVTIAGQNAATQADGTFTFSSVPSNAVSVSITAAGAVARTVTITLKTGQGNDLGDIFISDLGYNANVNGRVVTQDTLQPVRNAVVTIAGASTTTLADGTFSILNLPVGLGNTAGTVGKVVANGYDVKLITADLLKFGLGVGNNPIGDILIASPVSGIPPAGPFTIKGTLTLLSAKVSTPFQVNLTGGLGVGLTVNSDASGNYSFWVPAGAYTVTVPAQNGFGAQTASVTLVRADQPVTVPTINIH